MNIPLEERLIVALDAHEPWRMVETVGDSVKFFKIGLPLIYNSMGFELVYDLRRLRKKVFLDAKLYDIGNTIKRAIASIIHLNVDFVTVIGHESESAAKSEISMSELTDLEGARKYPKILSVPTLSSSADGKSVTFNPFLGGNSDGYVLSGVTDINMMRTLNKNTIIVSPGIRFKGEHTDDHKRFCTPKEAIAAGADYIVMGRSIIHSLDMKGAVKRAFDEIEEGLQERK